MTAPKRTATHISLTGEAEEQLKEIKKRIGGTLPQIVRQAIKMLYDHHFPSGHNPQAAGTSAN